MMTDEIFERVERLYKEGKITEEEKEKLLKVIKGEEKTSPTEGEIKFVEIQGIKNDLVKISGVEGLKTVQISGNAGSVDLKIVGEKAIINSNIIKKGFGFVRIGGGGDVININVPRKIEQIDLKVVSSDVIIEKVEGKINVSVVSGDCRFDDIKGEISFSGLSSDVDLNKIEGKLSVNTKSGDVKIKDSKIFSSIKTYSGDIDINNTVINGFEITAYSGDIDAVMSNFLGETSLSTFFGDIEIDIDPVLNFVVAETTSGEIDSDSIVGEVRNGIFAYGSGSIKVSLKTKSGDIAIRAVKKEA